MAVRLEEDQVPKSFKAHKDIATAPRRLKEPPGEPFIVGSSPTMRFRDGHIYVHRGRDIEYVTHPRNKEILEHLVPINDPGYDTDSNQRYLEQGFSTDEITRIPQRGVLRITKGPHVVDVYTAGTLMQRHTDPGVDELDTHRLPVRRGIAGVLLLQPEWMEGIRRNGIFIRDTSTVNDNIIFSHTVGIPGFRMFFNPALRETLPATRANWWRWFEPGTLFFFDTHQLSLPNPRRRLSSVIRGMRPIVLTVKDDHLPVK